MLVRIDPVGHVITMVSVPRDTPYEYNGKVEKINQMFAVNGAAGAVTAVQDLTGVKISDYVEIEFAGLAEFVDSIGGIYVDVPYTIDYQVYTQDQRPSISRPATSCSTASSAWRLPACAPPMATTRRPFASRTCVRWPWRS